MELHLNYSLCVWQYGVTYYTLNIHYINMRIRHTHNYNIIVVMRMPYAHVIVYACMYVCVCVRACVRACMCVCVHSSGARLGLCMHTLMHACVYAPFYVICLRENLCACKGLNQGTCMQSLSKS